MVLHGKYLFRRGDLDGRPQPGAEQLASASRKPASCFTLDTGDHQGRSYRSFHNRPLVERECTAHEACGRIQVMSGDYKHIKEGDKNDIV